MSMTHPKKYPTMQFSRRMEVFSKECDVGDAVHPKNMYCLFTQQAC